jgi:hypothetical protein
MSDQIFEGCDQAGGMKSFFMLANFDDSGIFSVLIHLAMNRLLLESKLQTLLNIFETSHALLRLNLPDNSSSIS